MFAWYLQFNLYGCFDESELVSVSVSKSDAQFEQRDLPNETKVNKQQVNKQQVNIYKWNSFTNKEGTLPNKERCKLPIDVILLLADYLI